MTETIVPVNHEGVDRLICSMPRSGGHLLLDMLAQGDGPPAGEWPTELPDGARVALVHAHYVAQLPDPWDLRPSVYLYRRNLLAQAVSWAAAGRTGRWHDAATPPLELNVGTVTALLGQLQAAERTWLDWFSATSTPVLPVAYEDLLDTDGAPTRAARRAVAFLGGRHGFEWTPRTARQGTWVNETWAAAAGHVLGDLADRAARLTAANGYRDADGYRLDGLVPR